MKLFSSILFSLVLLVGVGLFSIQHADAQVAACTSPSGYSTTTGMPCNGSTVLPIGCTTTAGFSGSTGTPCNGYTSAANGYNGTMVGTNGFLNGCVATSGYSATTGMACNTPINGLIYTGNGTTVNIGLPTTPVTTPPVSDPGLPTTGAGQNTLLNLAILLGSALVAAVGIRYAIRYSAAQSNA